MKQKGLFPAHGLQDAVVDKLRLAALHGIQYLGHLLGGSEVVALHGELLAPGAFPGSAPARFFFLDFFHRLRKMCIFANENPSGEVSLPLAQNLILMTSLRSMMKVKNQTLTEIRAFIRLSGFHFSYSFQGFRIPLFCHLLTLQRYENCLNYANIFKIIFEKIAIFFKKNLLGMDIIPIFATSKLSSGQNAAGEQPAIFVPAYFPVKQYGCTVSGSSNGPGASLERLRQRVVQLFYVLKFQVMNQTMRLGQVVRPSILSSVERIVKNWKTWLNARSKTFSAICGEEFTHKQVVIAHAAFALLILACCLAELFEKGGTL